MSDLKLYTLILRVDKVQDKQNICLIQQRLPKGLLVNVYIIFVLLITIKQHKKYQTIPELLFEPCEKKSFLHWIVSPNKKWVYYEHRSVRMKPGESGSSTPKCNIHAKFIY